jgi:hypothetical protein
MPFLLIAGVCRSTVFIRRLGQTDLNTSQGPTYTASQKPMQYAKDENNPVLRSRQISAKDVDQCGHPAYCADIEPPDDPAVNPHMNVMHKSS